MLKFSTKIWDSAMYSYWESRWWRQFQETVPGEENVKHRKAVTHLYKHFSLFVNLWIFVGFFLLLQNIWGDFYCQSSFHGFLLLQNFIGQSHFHIGLDNCCLMVNNEEPAMTLTLDVAIQLCTTKWFWAMTKKAMDVKRSEIETDAQTYARTFTLLQ